MTRTDRLGHLLRHRCTALLLGLWTALGGLSGLAQAQTQAPDRDEPIRLARDAFQKHDRVRLTALRGQVQESRHPLAGWVEYWELNNRLYELNSADIEAFYTRWPGSYLEDRLRNDWLLELGRRRDWVAFRRELPRFRMNDDREVACYGLLTEHLSGKDVRDAARRAWMAQKEADDGCQLLAQTLFDARQFSPDDVWRKLHQTIEHNRQRQARNTISLLSDALVKPLTELLEDPARYLARKASPHGPHGGELAALAIARIAAGNPDQAASALSERWGRQLGADTAAWAWAITARQGALALLPDSLEWSRIAWGHLKPVPRGKTGGTAAQALQPDWSDDTLAWHVRAALRLGVGTERWSLALRAIEAMSSTERAEPVWQYWRARALLELTKPGEGGEAQRAEARQILNSLAPQLGYYGQLAAEELGGPQPLPPRPAPLTPAEREQARAHPGLLRALAMLAAGLRPEAVREWNFSLLGMSDRELLAAAQWACEREVWDRCINSSERTRAEFDMEQRFPMPLRNELLARSKEIGLDPAYAYGLIRQESRFITDAKSAVGASGLMQVMPATGKWTAKKIGMTSFRPEMLAERDTNLKIGTAYLKLILDDFEGAQALAAAAYNAGPGRPRRWRDGPPLEPAIWAENVPFNETRDYVKKVLSNATYYAGMMAGKPASLKARLGSVIGPRASTAPDPSNELP